MVNAKQVPPSVPQHHHQASRLPHLVTAYKTQHFQTFSLSQLDQSISSSKQWHLQLVSLPFFLLFPRPTRPRRSISLSSSMHSTSLRKMMPRCVDKNHKRDDVPILRSRMFGSEGSLHIDTSIRPICAASTTIASADV